MTLDADDIDWGDAFQNNSIAFKGRPRSNNGNGHRSEPIEARVELVRLADVTMQPVRWAWPGHIAFGKSTIVAGDPGGGKSTLTCDVVARASRGLDWPDGARGCSPCRSLILAAEDAPDDTLLPRLTAMGADMKMVSYANVLKAGEKERMLQLGDVQPLAAALAETKATILVIDPITAYLGSADSHKDADVRGLLSPLMKMAEGLGVAVVAVMHLSKGGNRPALYRIGGSIGFTGVARMVFGVVADPETTDRRYLVSIKNNLAPEQPALAFRLGENGIAWEGSPILGLRANELMNNTTVESDDQVDADEFVAELLMRPGWPIKASDGMKAARANGINDRTMRRAIKRAGIVSVEGEATTGKFGAYEWHRPASWSPVDMPLSNSVSTVATGEKSNDLPVDTGGHLDDVSTGDVPVFNPRLAFTPPDPSR